MPRSCPPTTVLTNEIGTTLVSSYNWYAKHVVALEAPIADEYVPAPHAVHVADDIAPLVVE
jgi:hypothetical protein